MYGRYAAIERTDADLIYVQDDDCVVSDPRALWREWLARAHGGEGGHDHVVCNMPPEFRHSFYEDHALVGFGAVFHRGAPERAFARFWEIGGLVRSGNLMDEQGFYRTCDIAFTALTPRVLVDVPVENLPHAYHYDRMYRQSEHMAERARMRELVASIR